MVLVLIGGFLYFRNREAGETTQQDQEELALTEPSPTPLPTPAATPSADQLPEAGFPLNAAVVFSLFSIGGGIALRRKTKLL